MRQGRKLFVTPYLFLLTVTVYTRFQVTLHLYSKMYDSQRFPYDQE